MSHLRSMSHLTKYVTLSFPNMSHLTKYVTLALAKCHTVVTRNVTLKFVFFINIPGGVLPYIMIRHAPRNRVLLFRALPQTRVVFFTLSWDNPLFQGMFLCHRGSDFSISLTNDALHQLIQLFYHRDKNNIQKSYKIVLTSHIMLLVSRICLTSGYVLEKKSPYRHITTGSFWNFAGGACRQPAYLVPPPRDIVTINNENLC